jgi:uncharacterized protein YbbC (DUF1343 family)
MWKLLTLVFIPLIFLSSRPADDNDKKTLLTGADQVARYLPYLKGKRVGLLANNTSIIGNKSIADSLKALGVNIRMIFGPEHGFRGK